MRHDKPLLVKDGITGEKMAGQFGLRFRLPRKSKGSLTCRKFATWDIRHAVDLFAGFEPAILGTRGQHANH
jgi:hypothetical protein